MSNPKHLTLQEMFNMQSQREAKIFALLREAIVTISHYADAGEVRAIQFLSHVDTEISQLSEITKAQNEELRLND